MARIPARGVFTLCAEALFWPLMRRLAESERTLPAAGDCGSGCEGE